jgi:predicted RNA binding protein YcfA (HicA-like mRNA interferase family)
MKAEQITFADLEKLLLKLGFVKLQNPKYHIFEHPQENALVALPRYAQNDVVRPIHLVATRGTLEAYGLMSREAFEGLAEKIVA